MIVIAQDYGEHGWLSKYLCEDLPIGGTVKFKHIDFNVKIPAPFSQKKIGMIAGGMSFSVFLCVLQIFMPIQKYSPSTSHTCDDKKARVSLQLFKRFTPSSVKVPRTKKVLPKKLPSSMDHATKKTFLAGTC